MTIEMANAKPGAHAGRIAFHRLAKIYAEFREFLDESDLVLGIDAINPADEAQIVEAGERSLKSAAKGQRPGHAHLALELPAGRQLGAADQPDQGRFAGTVASENADAFARLTVRFTSRKTCIVPPRVG